MCRHHHQIDALGMRKIGMRKIRDRLRRVSEPQRLGPRGGWQNPWSATCRAARHGFDKWVGARAALRKIDWKQDVLDV
jgi:hypothetical protein